MVKNIVAKLKKEKLAGRSGSGFPTWLKWQFVKKEKAEKKFIICNGSEGEPGTFKDGFILQNYPNEVIEGIKIALEFLNNSTAYIYLRKDYYKRFGYKLKKLARNPAINIVKKQGGYLSGEETAICEAIEGKVALPRPKPPYPTQKGLWGYPTLVNNVETFYWVAKIAKNEYKNQRFFSISGDIKNPGVFQLPEKWTIKKVLQETKNIPNSDFFVQAGGGAAGEILLPNQLNRQIKGIATIIVFNRKKTDLFQLMKKWNNFFLRENCDKCTPCREGAFRIGEMLQKKKLDNKTLKDLFFVLDTTSLCPLGKIMVNPFKSLIENLL